MKTNLRRTNQSILFWMIGVTFLFPAIALTASNDVKILISKCSNGAVLSAGSGIGFTIDQTQYIVTSEHVVSIKSDTCYDAETTASQNPVKLDVVATDWANGLALLKLKSPITAPFSSITETFETQGITDNEVITSGYPQKSQQLARDRARVVINSSVRGGFVGQVQLLEMVGPLAEYGMSGGSARSSRNDKVIGLISHQRVFLTPGKPSLIASEGEVSGVQSNHFFVISSHSIVTWISRILRGNPPEFSRVSSELIRGLGLYFKQPAAADRLVLARQGGGDGVGATGDADETERPGITIEVAVANMNDLLATTQNQTSSEAEWVKALAHEILRKQKIEFTHLLIINEGSGDLSRASLRLRPIQSLNQMLAALRSGYAIPIPKSVQSADARPELLALRAALNLNTTDQDVENLLLIVKKLIDLKSENPDARLPHKYLAALEQHSGWNTLSDLDFEKAILIKRFLLSFSAPSGLAR